MRGGVDGENYDRNISKDDFRLGQISLYINLLCEARRQHHCAHSLHRAHRTLGGYDQHKLVCVPALFTRLTYRARKDVTVTLGFLARFRFIRVYLCAGAVLLRLR